MALGDYNLEDAETDEQGRPLLPPELQQGRVPDYLNSYPAPVSMPIGSPSLGVEPGAVKPPPGTPSLAKTNLAAMPQVAAPGMGQDAAMPPTATPLAVPVTPPAAVSSGFPGLSSFAKDRPLQPPPIHFSRGQRALGMLAGGLASFGKGPEAGQQTLQNYFQAPQERQDKETLQAQSDWDAKQAAQRQAAQDALAKSEAESKIALEKSEAEKNAREPEARIAHPPVPTEGGAFVYDSDTDKWDFKPGEGGKKETPAHITYDAGIPVTVTKGKDVYDINDPKLPAELKPLVDAATRAHGQHVKETEDSQVRVANAAADRQAAAFLNASKLKDDKNAVTQVQPYLKSYLQSDTNYRLMAEIANDLKSHGPMSGPESMALVARHMGINFPPGSGMRQSIQMIQAHIGARSLGQKLEAAWNGALNGAQITPEQAAAFVQMADENRRTNWDTVKKIGDAFDYKVPDKLSPDAVVGGKDGGEKVYRAINPKTGKVHEGTTPPPKGWKVVE